MTNPEASPATSLQFQENVKAQTVINDIPDPPLEAPIAMVTYNKHGNFLPEIEIPLLKILARSGLQEALINELYLSESSDSRSEGESKDIISVFFYLIKPASDIRYIAI